MLHILAGDLGEATFLAHVIVDTEDQVAIQMLVVDNDIVVQPIVAVSKNQGCIFVQIIPIGIRVTNPGCILQDIRKPQLECKVTPGWNCIVVSKIKQCGRCIDRLR